MSVSKQRISNCYNETNNLYGLDGLAVNFEMVLLFKKAKRVPACKRLAFLPTRQVCETVLLLDEKSLKVEMTEFDCRRLIYRFLTCTKPHLLYLGMSDSCF